MSTGVVFDVQRYALHDGPGIRTTVFLKGCPLRCLWCHNPEGQLGDPELVVRPERCLAECRACLSACPEKAIRKKAGRVRVDAGACRSCGACAEVCPTGALELAGRRISAADAVAEAARDAVFFEESGGGVTFSGGEPLAQPEFLEEMLKACRDRGLATAVDTCGYVPYEILERIEPLTDLFLYDLKVMDAAKHLKLTGADNALILDNIKRLVRSGARVVVRIPVVPGVNDDEDNIVRTAAFLKSLDSPPPVRLLLYHRLGCVKSRRLLRGRVGRVFPFQTAADMERVRRRYASLGLEVDKGD
ncbi:MAG: glycyl-radical enzyme activating protein [Candidatus Aminicenantes bacterium]|nr:glycyl-radical enzyme activating protein [Candidatus Aminicenantes bacterium]